MEWSVLIGGFCTVAGLLLSYAIFSRGKARDDARSGEERGTMLSDLGYIKSSVDDIKREQKDQREKNEAMIERISAVEQSAKQAHHRIDRLEGKERE